MKYSVCLLAAGQGVRTKLPYNKVLYKMDGKSILDFSLDLFLSDPDCAQIILTCSLQDRDAMQSYKKNSRIELVLGGNTRQKSVYNALQAVKYPVVFIHDAARPYLKREQVEELKKTMETEDACVLMVPSIDTVKIVENGYVVSTLDRNILYNAQTPQCFKTDLIRQCHDAANKEQKIATDDTQLVEWYSKTRVKVVIGDPANIKVTVPSDLK